MPTALFPESTLERAKKRRARQGLGLRWSPSPGASDREIEVCERRLRRRLPDDVREFLRSSNGMVIDEDSTLTLLGCNEIAERSERVWGEVEDEPAMRRLICLADYEDGNYVLLDTRKKAGSIVDGFCEELAYWADSAPAIADSFTEFARRLTRALEDGTPLIYWLRR